MSLQLRTNLGCVEAVIAENGGLNEFYHIANILSQDFDISFINKEDDFDTIDWEFRFKGHDMTLHYSIYNGVSLFPTKTRDALSKDNKKVVELAEAIQIKLLSDDQRHIA
ncbi:MAG: DUF3630 family protein [Chitinophagaceae bacterium]|nr:DUF3630 family protein [Chitinophagaceae bacterium]HQU56088.1 DUF3630 family protein [Chitinophagaceae bacterium]HQV06281.1 DUF3630 family protein [Chitinophagaceae bacterium]